MRGYFAIGIENCKTWANVGGLWRSAQALGASFIFTVGERYYRHATDTTKAWKSIPLFEYKTLPDFLAMIPRDCSLVGVETSGTKSLERFTHPERAIYLLGAEDRGLSEAAMAKCSWVVRIESAYCLNVATTGSIVMYDRISKATKETQLRVA